ncbi:MAG: IS66 family insertion sequence element accessory protein TnpA [Methylococcaceae bacterium]
MVPHQKNAVMKSHLSRWESSGLTQIAYCNQHDIKPHVFSYYKGKLSQGNGGSEALSSSLVPIDLLSSNAPLTMVFKGCAAEQGRLFQQVKVPLWQGRSTTR